MERALMILATVALAGCGLLEPERYWCAIEYHFTFTDSLYALPDTVEWNLAPDSVTYEWSEGGECPEPDES